MRARPLNEGLIWAGAALAVVLLIVAAWSGASLSQGPGIGPEAAAQGVEIHRRLHEIAELEEDGTLRLASRRFAHPEEGAWSADSPTVLDLSDIGWVQEALGADPNWAATLPGSRYLALKVEASISDIPPAFGAPDPGDPWRWRPWVPPGFEVPGHDGWTEGDGGGFFLLVPDDATGPRYRALCHWGRIEPDGQGLALGRCFVKVAYPSDPRLTVEWVVWFHDPGELGSVPFGALSGEALALARCFDVTDGGDKPPQACVPEVLEGEALPDRPR